jgi:hypothetical protein
MVGMIDFLKNWGKGCLHWWCGIRCTDVELIVSPRRKERVRGMDELGRMLEEGGQSRWREPVAIVGSNIQKNPATDEPTSIPRPIATFINVGQAISE